MVIHYFLNNENHDESDEEGIPLILKLLDQDSVLLNLLDHTVELFLDEDTVPMFNVKC